MLTTTLVSYCNAHHLTGSGPGAFPGCSQPERGCCANPDTFVTCAKYAVWSTQSCNMPQAQIARSLSVQAHLHFLAVGERNPGGHVPQRLAQALAPRRQVKLRPPAHPGQAPASDWAAPQHTLPEPGCPGVRLGCNPAHPGRVQRAHAAACRPCTTGSYRCQDDTYTL